MRPFRDRTGTRQAEDTRAEDASADEGSGERQAEQVLEAARAEARAITADAHRRARVLVEDAEVVARQRQSPMSATPIDLTAAPLDGLVLDTDTDASRLIDERNQNDLDRLHSASISQRWLRR